MPDRKKDIMNNNPMNNATEVKTVQVDLNKVFKTFYSNYLLDMDNLNTTGEWLITRGWFLLAQLMLTKFS